MQEMKKVGKKHFGVLYCAEAPACATVGALARKAASVAGGIAVSDGKIAGTQPKYTAQCLLMKNQGVDALMVASQSAVVLRVTSDCAAQGYKPLTTNQSADYSTEWLSSKDLEGAQIISPNAPYSDASLPAVKAFVDALNKYESGLTSGSQFGYATIFPWVGGQLFEAAVKQGGLTPDSKPADVAAAMYKLQGETLDGLSGPLTYVKGKPFVPACYWTTTINGGELVSGNSGKPTCLTAAQLKGLGLA
jgi:branched-chain amino acid transport system substrate-binding protein